MTTVLFALGLLAGGTVRLLCKEPNRGTGSRHLCHPGGHPRHLSCLTGDGRRSSRTAGPGLVWEDPRVMGGLLVGIYLAYLIAVVLA
jgi:hypothetical protein